MLKKLKNLKFFERIFYFLRDIPSILLYRGILNSTRYSSSCKPGNYLFLVGFQLVTQIYNPFDI